MMKHFGDDVASVSMSKRLGPNIYKKALEQTKEQLEFTGRSGQYTSAVNNTRIGQAFQPFGFTARNITKSEGSVTGIKFKRR